LADVAPLFESALKELEVQVTSWEQAIDIIGEAYLVSLAEGVCTPQETTRQVYSDYMALLYDRRRNRRERGSFGPLAQLIDLYYQYEYYHEGYYGADQQVPATLDVECISLAKNWCRERWLPSVDSSWLTSTVIALARGINDERAYERLPILADALQDAGCDYADILDHCRGPGPHVRGCWVVDLVLGKE
jgi:hypothetical protein